MSIDRRKRAFSLVEVTLALGIASFAIMTCVALLPIGMQSEQNTRNETSAIDLMHGIISDFNNTPATNTTSTPATINTASSHFSLQPLPSNVTAYGQQTFYATWDQKIVASANQAQYRVTISSWPASASKPASMLIRVAWPAMTADQSATAVESYVMFPVTFP